MQAQLGYNQAEEVHTCRLFESDQSLEKFRFMCTVYLNINEFVTDISYTKAPNRF